MFIGRRFVKFDEHQQQKKIKKKSNKITFTPLCFISKGDCGGGWLMNRTKEGYKFYFNVNTMEYAWERPKDVTKDHSILTREEIQVGIVCQLREFFV